MPKITHRQLKKQARNKMNTDMDVDSQLDIHDDTTHAIHTIIEPDNADTTTPGGEGTTGQEHQEQQSNALSKREKRYKRHQQWLNKLHRVYDSRLTCTKSNTTSAKSTDRTNTSLPSTMSLLALGQTRKSTTKSLEMSDLFSSITTISSTDDSVAFSSTDTSTPAQVQDKMQKNRNKVVSQRSRRMIAIKESVRMQNVLGLEVFRKNPLQAIREHVVNTVE